VASPPPKKDGKRVVVGVLMALGLMAAFWFFFRNR
jgi:hypothetical protein